MSRPSDLALTLACVPVPPHRDLMADELRARLHMLGFKDLTAQQVAGWLGRLARLDSPPVEQVHQWGGPLAYRITLAGRTWLSNRLRWTRKWQ